MIPYVILALLGIIIGSFLNVCIYRIPKRQSISYPASHCMDCQHPLKPLDLIPVVSYLFLAGRCRYCSSKVSAQYPLVEIINGGLYMLVYHYFGMSIESLVFAILLSTLLTIGIIDFHTMRIPNPLIIFGTSVGLTYLVGQAIYQKSMTFIAHGMVGFLVGGGMIAIIMALSLLILKKDGMGMGDLKLLAMIGLFVGGRNVLLAFFIAAMIGSVYGLLKREKIFPFGPFLSMGAVIALIWGDKLWNTYINFIL